jgi:AraC-like DNA-binding protein
MTATDKSLSMIAQDAGFADQPHLSRHFVRETGTTPAAFRRLVAE